MSHLALNPYRVVADRQTDTRTDRIPIANTRSQQYLPVQLSRVINSILWRNLLISWQWSTVCSAWDVRVTNRRETRFSRHAWLEWDYGQL